MIKQAESFIAELLRLIEINMSTVRLRKSGIYAIVHSTLLKDCRKDPPASGDFAQHGLYKMRPITIIFTTLRKGALRKALFR